MADDFKSYLSEHGVKPTFQRMKIYEYLYNSKSHPTIDMIYRDLVKSIPTLSMTTVYNTLNLFVEKGVVLLLQMKENEAHYDGNVSFHGHFKCEVCKKIYDFSADLSDLNFPELENFKLNEMQLSFKGLCNECSKNYKNL